MKFSIRDLLLVTMIVALAIGWFLDRQTLATIAEDLVKLAEENKQLRIQVDLGAIDLAAQNQAFEQYKLKTLKSQTLAPNRPKD